MDGNEFVTKARESLLALERYCRERDYKGWDPYDGLNSRLFKAMPLVGRSAICRLMWIQLFKRNPLNLRGLAGVPREHNAKGIGLFLKGYCNLWHLVKADARQSAHFGTLAGIEATIARLGELLGAMRAEGYAGAAWGYNFPWQCRREFLFPANEPTVVATRFCAEALLDAWEITGREDFRDMAASSADFVLRDLRTTPYGGGRIISYSRMPGNDTIFNASLLGAGLLARIHSVTGREDCLELAADSARACCAAQREDGSWTYGVKAVTGWIDSFHTGYNLEGLAEYERYTGDTSHRGSMERGAAYYVRTFFAPDGTSSYYHDRTYPIDIHCPGELPLALGQLGLYGEHRELARRVVSRAIDTMQAPEGYFYYQLKRRVNSRISYMRWSNAFMFASLTQALREEQALEG